MMKYLLTLLLLLISSVTLAESGAYRVEVIVFRNLTVTAEPSPQAELRSFSQYPDLEPPKPVIRPIEEPADTQTQVLTDELPVELTEVLRSDLPDDLEVVTEKSNYMADVWRRLRSSETYRPLVYNAWQQNRVDYYPPIRIHDQQVIDTQLRPPTHIMVADLTAPDPLAAYRSTFYQLDGSVQLRRSRFLHIYLDLEYREQPAQGGTGADLMTAAPADIVSGEAFWKIGSGHEVFTLKQNRQVRTSELQYFDTPHFGALVFVSAVQGN